MTHSETHLFFESLLTESVFYKTFDDSTTTLVRHDSLNTIHDFLEQNGIPESDLILDGTFKEIKTPTFKGWYVGDDLGEGKRSITIEDWRTRDRKSFIEGVDLSDPAERQKLEDIRLKYEKEKKDLQLLKRDFADSRLEYFRQEHWKEPSRYLIAKHIEETFGAIEVESRVETTDLIVPMYDKDGVLWNYQTIQDSGAKSFVPGALVDGCFFELESRGPEDQETIFICEGFATAASVKMARPSNRVVCAFSANNLLSVAEVYREKLPQAPIIICGDDDFKRSENAGKIKAEAAAKAVHGTYVLPTFDVGNSRQENWTDFNDLHVIAGLNEVRAQLNSAAIEVVHPSPEWSDAFKAAKAAEESTTKASAKAQSQNLQRVESLNAIDPYINGVAPIEMRLNKTGQPILPTEFVVATHLFKYYDGRTVISEGSIFIFDKTHWKEVDQFNEAKIMVQLQVLYNGLASNSRLKATYEQWTYLLPKAPRNLFEPRPNVVNFTNGTLTIAKFGPLSKWNYHFKPGHDKNDFCTHIIPIEYDETRSIRNKPFEEMLERVFSKSLDKEGKIKAIRQMYGACVAPIFPHLFMLWGQGGSGKSSLIIPAQRLVHVDNWSSVEPHEFEGFLMESMAGKLINIVLDIDTQEPIKDNHIKKIEDRVPVRIDRKFKTAIKAPLPAVHIFGGNEIPATYEKGSGAHKRRWTFLHIEGFQATGNYSKNFANELFEANPQGILNFALDGLQEILDSNGHYFTPESGAQKMDDWQIEHDPVALFLREIEQSDVQSLGLKTDGRVKRSAVWPVFVEWYKLAYNRPPRISKSKFFEALIKSGSALHPISLHIIDGVRYFFGLSDSGEVDQPKHSGSAN